MASIGKVTRLILLVGGLTQWSALAQGNCDARCLKLWFAERFDDLRLAPTEVQVDFLLRAARVETSVERKRYVLEQAEDLIGLVPELAPVLAIVGFTDSIPGEANRATDLGLNQMDYQMRLVSLYSTFDFEEAVSRWMAYRPPAERRDRALQGETIGYLPLYRTALELYDQYVNSGNPAGAEGFLARVLNGIETYGALGDLNEVLTSRSREGRLPRGFLKLYLNRLATFQPNRVPHEVEWYKIVAFWKLLMEKEVAGDKKPLLGAIAQLMRKTAELPALDLCITVVTAGGDKKLCRYWPTEAGQWWERMMGRLQFSADEEELLQQIRDHLSQGGKVTGGKITEVSMTKYWARGKSKAFLERVIELQRSYRELYAAGTWEPMLGGLIEDLKHHAGDKPTEAERMTAFMEVCRVYQGFIGFAYYDRSLPLNKENAAEVQKQLETRSPHFAREQLIGLMLSHLESEEGQWVYRQRRLLWLGVLARMVQELQTGQPAMMDAFRKRALVSSHEVIRIYGAHI